MTPPPMILRIKALVSALWLAARLFCSGEPVIVPPEHQKRRIAVCKGCPYRNEGVIDSCDVCGCSIQAKAMLLHPGCPDGRWANIDGSLRRSEKPSFFLRIPRASFSH